MMLAQTFQDGAWLETFLSAHRQTLRIHADGETHQRQLGRTPLPIRNPIFTSVLIDLGDT